MKIASADLLQWYYDIAAELSNLFIKILNTSNPLGSLSCSWVLHALLDLWVSHWVDAVRWMALWAFPLALFASSPGDCLYCAYTCKMRTRRIIVIICTMLADNNPAIKIYCSQIEFQIESLQTHTSRQTTLKNESDKSNLSVSEWLIHLKSGQKPHKSRGRAIEKSRIALTGSVFKKTFLLQRLRYPKSINFILKEQSAVLSLHGNRIVLLKIHLNGLEMLYEWVASRISTIANGLVQMKLQKLQPDRDLFTHKILCNKLKKWLELNILKYWMKSFLLRFLSYLSLTHTSILPLGAAVCFGWLFILAAS